MIENCLICRDDLINDRIECTIEYFLPGGEVRIDTGICNSCAVRMYEITSSGKMEMTMDDIKGRGLAKIKIE